MNDILTQLPRAQESYMQTVAIWESLDITDTLLRVDSAIRETVAKGNLGCVIGGFTNSALAEKVSEQLAWIGYRTYVVSNGIEQIGGVLVPVYSLSVSWAIMPENRRDAYTV